VQSLDPTAVAGSIVIVGTAVEFLRRGFRALYRGARRFNEMHEAIVNELLPNGGGSMRDKLYSIDRRLTKVEKKIDGQISRES